MSSRIKCSTHTLPARYSDLVIYAEYLPSSQLAFWLSSCFALQDVAALESQPLLGFFLREEKNGPAQKLQFKLYHKNTLFYIFKADDIPTAQRYPNIIILTSNFYSSNLFLCVLNLICKYEMRWDQLMPFCF